MITLLIKKNTESLFTAICPHSSKTFQISIHFTLSVKWHNQSLVNHNNHTIQTKMSQQLLYIIWLYNQIIKNKERNLTFTLEVALCPFDHAAILNACDEIGGTRLPQVTCFTRVTKFLTNLKAVLLRGFSQINQWNFWARTCVFIWRDTNKSRKIRICSKAWAAEEPWGQPKLLHMGHCHSESFTTNRFCLNYKMWHLLKTCFLICSMMLFQNTISKQCQG